MKKILILLLLLALGGTSLIAQQAGNADDLKIVRLVGVSYMQRIREFKGSSASFEDYKVEIDNWGVGGSVFAGYGPIGVFSQGSLFVPTSHDYTPSPAIGGDDMKGFRLGLDNLSGVGINLEVAPSVGILLGGGLHWSVAFLYKDQFYEKEGNEPALYFDLGLGGSASLYIMVNEAMNIHIGANSNWDFLTLHGNSYLNQNWDKSTRWTYGFNGGVGFRI